MVYSRFFPLWKILRHTYNFIFIGLSFIKTAYDLLTWADQGITTRVIHFFAILALYTGTFVCITLHSKSITRIETCCFTTGPTTGPCLIRPEPDPDSKLGYWVVNKQKR